MALHKSSIIREKLKRGEVGFGVFCKTTFSEIIKFSKIEALTWNTWKDSAR